MKTVKHVSSDLASAIRNNRVVAGAGLLVMSGMAAATEPATGAAAAWTQLEADATAMLDSAWPIVILMTLGFIGIKLFKKGANKAT
tara:strand:+ start:214 stop:471 length:258 start_codon:yes stop_codon:yes gene_type:complete